MPKKLTARQRAARKARAAWCGISPEGLERLRAAAHEHRPWERSTGPRTPEGKARARRNAVRNGARLDVLMPREQAELLLAIERAELAGEGAPSPDQANAMLEAGIKASRERGDHWHFFAAISLYARWQNVWRRHLAQVIG